MGNAFDTPAMAAGYARSRPAVHPHILERARPHLRLPLPVDHALDVGCGAGLSTRALQSLARRCLGIDPSDAMVKCATALVPGAAFMVSRAEALPVPSRSMNLITAAGSLDYVMTETNVAHAVQRGVPEPQIRSWCAETLAPVFQGPPGEVLFPGYLACLVREPR